MRSELEERFVRYVQIDTTSDEFSNAVPSTACQYDLLNLLAQELRDMGAADVLVTAYGCVLATIPATVKTTVPTVAFLAHVDTSPAFSGTDVRPLIHRNYQGDVLVLPDDPTQKLDPVQFPYLTAKIGDDLVTASGTTLLGADDKAGVAIIMTLAQHLLTTPDLVHGTVRLCFTPDEEIGRGVAHLTLEDLGADVAYTLDGAEEGAIVFETFSADKATITLKGVSAHPGYAYGKMVNAAHLAAKLIDRLPQENGSPETTSGHDGFIHVYKATITSAEATIHLILRDFEREGLAEKGAHLQQLCATLQNEEPRATIECTIEKQYRNMRYWLEKDMRPVDFAVAATEACGIRPVLRATRGGTDGSRLTEMGLPTPNIFTGMQNFHGPLEWVSLQDMEKATQVCIELLRQWQQNGDL